MLVVKNLIISCKLTIIPNIRNHSTYFDSDKISNAIMCSSMQPLIFCVASKLNEYYFRECVDIDDLKCINID